MDTEPRELELQESDRIRKSVQRLPFMMALVFGTMWGLLFLFLGRIHAMWPMYDKEFPFLLASLIGVHKETMSPIMGMLFAFLDGALVAFTLSWLFTLLLRNRSTGGSGHHSRRLTVFITAGMFVLFAIVARGCPH